MLSTRPLLTLLACISLVQSAAADGEDNGRIRFASFNIAMGLASEGELEKRLQSGGDGDLQKIAAIIQQVRPDILLLNEFDFSEAGLASLFVANYLNIPQSGNTPIKYAHTMTGAVNTGVDSGLDLNGNGTPGEPQDAWGFGHFPGQYGMMVLSRFPLELNRSFQHFKWGDMPDALIPMNTDGTNWYPDNIWNELRLSSKNHWDINVNVGDHLVHFLVSHPTPPVFDGPEDRNGTRNHDEIRLWADYLDPQTAGYIYDDEGTRGGLETGAHFVIAGDLNADPADGDSHGKAINQLLAHQLVDNVCVPASQGAKEASKIQGEKNLEHRGDPSTDTADFNDRYTGNLRIDYVLPSTTLKVTDCGVFWPAEDQPGHEWVDVSDHHLVWVDIIIRE